MPLGLSTVEIWRNLAANSPDKLNSKSQKIPIIFLQPRENFVLNAVCYFSAHITSTFYLGFTMERATRRRRRQRGAAAMAEIETTV